MTSLLKKQTKTKDFGTHTPVPSLAKWSLVSEMFPFPFLHYLKGSCKNKQHVTLSVEYQ